MLGKLDAYFRASNFLSVGQIYLFDNPLLKALSSGPMSSLGWWGTGAQPLVSISFMST